jgi:hypothetical protein
MSMPIGPGTRCLLFCDQADRMGFRKAFRAGPVMPAAHYRRKQQVASRKTAVRYLGIAAAAGVLIGGGSAVFSGNGLARISQAAKATGVWTGVLRAREPQVGDTWRGCDEARSAGTAPIYAGEPGYREGLDGDNDGIACEPYRGA